MVYLTAPDTRPDLAKSAKSLKQGLIQHSHLPSLLEGAHLTIDAITRIITLASLLYHRAHHLYLEDRLHLESLLTCSPNTYPPSYLDSLFADQ